MRADRARAALAGSVLLSPTMKLSLVIAWFASASWASAQAPASEPLPALVPEITRAELEAHVRFLASDELRGRATGSVEGLRAARYLAHVLESYGVAPAGDEGFLQRVPLERSRMSAAPELALVAKDGSKWNASLGADYDWPSSEERVTAELRVVVVRNITELPAQADPKAALFFDMSTSERRGILTKRGNAGAEGWGLLLEAGREQAGKPRTQKSTPWSSAQRPRASAKPRDVWLRAHGELLARLRKGDVSSIRLTTHVEREPIEAWNVVGVLRGRGTVEQPTFASEAVVVSAHYDHLGVRDDDASASGRTEDSDRIFNGADDDASGCAAVLEIAGALAKAPTARTVVFLLDTGEELGLLGIDEYLARPAVPLEKTVADLNFEMIGRPDDTVGGAGKLWLTGDERSNLGAALREAGLPVRPDPYPDQNFFGRSDNIAFVHKGVVGQSFSTYAHGRHADYHEVSDSWDKLDYEHMEGAVRAGHQAVELVVSGKLRPAWLPGKEPAARNERSTR